MSRLCVLTVQPPAAGRPLPAARRLLKKGCAHQFEWMEMEEHIQVRPLQRSPLLPCAARIMPVPPLPQETLADLYVKAVMETCLRSAGLRGRRARMAWPARLWRPAARLPPSAFRLPPSAFRLPPSAFRLPPPAFAFRRALCGPRPTPD
jgi:hypothetical protein